MTFADDMQEWKRKAEGKQKQQEREEKIKGWRQKFDSVSGTKWKELYKSYLGSTIWKEIRERKLAQSNYQCEKCGFRSPTGAYLHVHHNNYHRIGGREKDSDLKVVCEGICHNLADKQREQDTEHRIKENRYQGLLYWFATKYKKYDDDWRY